MNKAGITNFLRKIKLMYLADMARYHLLRLKNRKNNKNFIRQNPEVKLPPDYLMYESFQMNYQKYYTSGLANAQWLKDSLKPYVDFNNKRILDWGCGPGRIIRHLPKVLGDNCEYYGTDYNRKSIKWCAEHLNGIHFNANSIDAELPYKDNFFDVIYGLSILTHLSEQLHQDWVKELRRVLKPEGVLLLTTHGDNFKTKLTEAELKNFNNGKLVVRGNVKEGHRTFCAFQPKKYMENLFSNMTVLDHILRKPTSKSWLPQDVWILKNN